MPVRSSPNRELRWERLIAKDNRRLGLIGCETELIYPDVLLCIRVGDEKQQETKDYGFHRPNPRLSTAK